MLSSDAYNPYKLRAQLNAYRDFMNTHRSDASSRSGGADSWGISRGVNSRLAHEIAHQWFPHQAMPATARDTWLSESFAEYLSGLAMSMAQTEGRDMEGYRQQFAGWQFEAKACKDVGSLETATMLGGSSGYREYACLVYNRGPLVLHMLHTLVGNEKFFAILKRFLERGKAGPVTSEDLRQAAEAVLQADMAWFFDQWVRQGGIPEITVEYRVSAGPDDTFVLSGRVAQADGPSFKKIHIPFVLEMGGDRRDLRLLFQDQPVKEFRFDLPGKPKKVSIDPAQNNLAVYR
jgi:aminopeptidase N